MCGRYKLNARFEDVQKYFDLIDGDTEFEPRDEIFPGTDIFVVKRGRVPTNVFWTITERDSKGVLRRVINAKSETAHVVPMFRDALRNGRILIPATGFYEWKELPDKRKEKYAFEYADPLFAFAGIARKCEVGGKERECGVILTTEANNVVREIHTKNRMPVILRREDYEKWLDPETPLDDLKSIMQPVHDDEIKAYQVEKSK
ncbi:MAG: hypothetical protein C4324_05895 [Blastocatellia bacterium]